jgi:hypothetical protein
MRPRPLPISRGLFCAVDSENRTFSVQFMSDAINALDFLDLVFGMAFLGVIPFTRNRPVPEGSVSGVSNRYMLAPQKSVYLGKVSGCMLASWHAHRFLSLKV